MRLPFSIRLELIMWETGSAFSYFWNYTVQIKTVSEMFVIWDQQ